MEKHLPARPLINRCFRLYMDYEESPPLSIFGIRIKTILIVLLFITMVLVAVNRSEIESLLHNLGISELQKTERSEDTGTISEDSHIVVDQEMLSKAMQEVHVEKLTELESQDSTTPTDRFFYVLEIVNGGDLEGIDLTIEPDYVTIVSEGGTKTTIKRTMVRKIHRFKLPPSSETEQVPK